MAKTKAELKQDFDKLSDLNAALLVASTILEPDNTSYRNMLMRNTTLCRRHAKTLDKLADIVGAKMDELEPKIYEKEN